MTPPDDSEPQPPTIIDRPAEASVPSNGTPPSAGAENYVLGAEIARGGMGYILEAEDTKLKRTVAAKLMIFDSDTDEGMKQRFLREAEVLALLSHPNVVPIHDIVWENGVPLFYTMKRVNGRTLQAILHDLRKEDAAAVRDFTLDRLLLVFRKVCDALACAHSKGIIHRDLKPENIMIGEFGEVLVMDWGLAKTLGGHRAVDAPARGTDGAVPSSDPLARDFGSTLQGSVMGTPQYMSPEQARGEIDALDQRSDIFSLGGILYAILTLRPPVEGATLDEVLTKVRSALITPLDGGTRPPGALSKTSAEGVTSSGDKRARRSRSTVPPALAAVAMKALRLDKAQRYQDIAALSADIEAYQAGFATSAEQAGAWKQLTLLIKRHKAASLGVAAVLLVGTTLGTKAFIEGKRAEREAVRARSEAARAERGEAAAKATLADLRRTAPIFFAQAKIVLEEGDLEDALEKIGYAIQLDDANADYHLFRAHLRQSAQELAPAAEGYRRVLALRPEDASAKLNLALCEKLLRESGGGALQLEQQRELLAALRTQKRLVESAPLAALIDPDTATAKAALLVRLREYQKQPGWKDQRVAALPDGTFQVHLYVLAIGDLSVLLGQPVSELALNNSNISDLSSLAGLPLKDLNLLLTKVSDLSPLRGMPLESLNLGQTLVTDLSPLRGMKLRKLTMGRTGVSDLSPLAGMPLTDLDCFDAKSIADLAPLKGAPLVSFHIRGATQVTSLAPLAGAPLKILHIEGLSSVSDLSPLAQCPGLEELTLKGVPVTDLTPLARLPITRLDCGGSGKLADLSPLRGMPLRFLRLAGTPVTDLRPLADCPALEELILPARPLDLTPLRHLPKLRRLSTRSVGEKMTPAQTAEEFWKAYDAQPKPAGK